MCRSCPRCEVCGEVVPQPAPPRYWLGLIAPLALFIVLTHVTYQFESIGPQLYWFMEGMFLFAIPVAVWTDPHLEATIQNVHVSSDVRGDELE